MKILFNTTQYINGKQASFDVSFYDDAYHFLASDSSSPSFSLRREGDEWLTTDIIDDNTRETATAALDKYLLSQH